MATLLGGVDMSNVNADLETIRKSAQNLRSALESVSRTKSHLSSAYQKLGVGWNDKKYKELGDIIIECNRALSNLEKILLQSNKYTSALVSSLQEYESVNLGNSSESDNPFMQNLRNMAAYYRETSNYQYCMGVVTRGNISAQYKSVLSERHNNAEPNVRKVFDSFVQKLNIQDANLPPDQPPHYSPHNYDGHNRGVYLNTDADMHNPRGPGSTFYHELAHMIDHASTGYHSNLSNTQDFGNALMEDGQRVLSAYNNMSSERRTNFLTRIHQDSAHSFSDLIDATTNGELYGRYGHSREYWQRSGNLQAEAFAHFFEASMGDGWKLELLSNLFPTAFAIFREKIESILPEERIHILERGI